jgi:hypothetical protein
VQAAQITFEDFFLSSMDISALKIVGFEGLWGSLAMFLVMLPVVQVRNAYACVACRQPFLFHDFQHQLTVWHGHRLGAHLPAVQHLPGAEGSGIHENSLDTWHVSPKLAQLPLHQCHQNRRSASGAGIAVSSLYIWILMQLADDHTQPGHHDRSAG